MLGPGLKRPLKGSCRATADDPAWLCCGCGCVGAFASVVEERGRQTRPRSSSEVSFQEEEEEEGCLLLEEGCIFEGYGIQRTVGEGGYMKKKRED